MSKAETDAAIARNSFVEQYIKELTWSDQTHDDIVSAVAGNLRGFWGRVEASRTELFTRYHEAKSLIRRSVDAYYRDGHEDGEPISEVMSDALLWVSAEDLEDEIFPSDDQLASFVLKEVINSELKKIVDTPSEIG